jgi:hypothetical protein
MAIVANENPENGNKTNPKMRFSRLCEMNVDSNLNFVIEV